MRQYGSNKVSEMDRLNKEKLEKHKQSDKCTGQGCKECKRIGNLTRDFFNTAR